MYRALVALAAFASVAQTPLAAQSRRSADLVVLIAVDQLRPDYLERWRGQLDGGLARLVSSGTFFPNAIQDHALTETAPGHASMLSGRFPTHTGIWSNSGGVEDPSFPLLGGLGVDAEGRARGASPRRFIGTALYDWIRARDAQALALGVSRKDRAAILPIGRAGAPDAQVAWYVDGRFTTSAYYGNANPEWLSRWNARLDLGAFAGRRWELARGASSYPEADDAAWENGGKDRVFPHTLPADKSAIASRLERVPWMDSLTLDVAFAGLKARPLGRRSNAAQPDLLSISLSTTDAIGHDFGPDSREVHDHVLRLDRWLGAFLDSLATLVPRERTVFVLTADHGVSPMPERLAAEKQPGGRIDVASIAKRLAESFDARWSTDFSVEFDNGLLTADVDAMRARGVNVDSIANALVGTVSKLAGVQRAFSPARLRAASASDADAGRWRRTLTPTLGWLVAGVAKPGFVFSDGAKAEHGTMQPESRRVPILFVGPGIAARVDSRVIRTVDIAPTIASLVGARPTQSIDGVIVDLGAKR